MNREQIIEFLTGLRNGTRSIDELKIQAKKTIVLVEWSPGVFSNSEIKVTREQLDTRTTGLSGPHHLVLIKNPHLV